MDRLSPSATAVSSAGPGSGSPWLAIVGIGEDGRAGLNPAALRALESAELVVGGERHLELAGRFSGERLVWPRPLSEAFRTILGRRGRPVCVLATGDPFNFGVGADLARLVPADEIVCYPQPSAFSLAAARLAWSLPDCVCISLHGRALERIVPSLQPGARILALSWDGSTPGRLATLLQDRGFGRSQMAVLERMGGPEERILRSDAQGFALSDLHPLNTVAVEVVAESDARVIALTPGLPDLLFENDGQLTKAEIRALTLAALAPRAGELLWDIGAGSGSVSIEWMLRHPRNRAVAVEAREDRCERILRNARALGVPDIALVRGQAPAALQELPEPDAVFIGGGFADPGVFEACWTRLRSGGRLVVNAVTLETEARLLALFSEQGGSLKRIALSRADPVGSLHGWRPAMPVTQWAVTKP